MDAWDRLLFDWHAAALTLEPERFRSWALAGLRSCLPFDRTVWAGGSVDAEPRIGADRDETRSAQHPFEGSAPDRSLTVEDRAGGFSTRQSIRLLRSAAAPPFSEVERAQFSRLAPHLMLADGACRRWFLLNAQLGVRPKTEAVALVDRDGALPTRPEPFVAMLQREWSGWRGDRLPAPLLELAARRDPAPGRFVGQHIATDFVSAGRFQLVIARLRHATDGLTGREAEVARHYAAGSNFRQIAEGLGVAPATVRSHLRTVFSKLEVHTKTQLAAALR